MVWGKSQNSTLVINQGFKLKRLHFSEIHFCSITKDHVHVGDQRWETFNITSRQMIQQSYMQAPTASNS